MGYYEANDGGAGNYIINQSESNNFDNLLLMNGLNATLIVKGTLNILQIGTNGDGSTDDIDYINFALANYKDIYLPNRNYYISTTIVINSNYNNFKCDGTLTCDGECACVNLESNFNNIYINKIVSLLDGFTITDVSSMRYNNDITLNYINAKNHAVYLVSSNNGIQYNNIRGIDIRGNNNSIYCHCLSNGGWVNENRFFNFHLSSKDGNGIYCSDEKNNITSSSVSGNRFSHVAFEGVKNAINLNNAFYNQFLECRTQESIDNKHIILSGSCISNTINKDLTRMDLIENNLTNGYNNIVNGVIFNNKEGITVTNQLYISKTGLNYIPINNGFLNLFLQDADEITLEINEIFNQIYTDISIKTGMTIKLGNCYCHNLMRGIPISFTTGENGCKIIDINNKVILDTSETNYQNYKKFTVTLEAQDRNNKFYWSKKLVN